MRLNKMVSVVLACMLIVGTTAVPASAFEAETKSLEINTINDVASRATSSFTMSIPARSKVLADSSFLMTSGETVTIKAS